MRKCKACGREFASTNPHNEICYPCNNALKRLNGYAVPVVRCKDCKNNGQCSIQDAMNWTPKTEIVDYFCSYGERKDNG